MRTSLIISTYNSPVYLGKVLDGVRLQTALPDEVIIADDGSGPETADVVQGFAGDSPCPVIHEWQEDVGYRLSRIRNNAIARSTGDYIIFLDGDCVPEKNFMADHVHLAGEGFFFQGKRLLLSREVSAGFEASHISSGRLVGLLLRGGVKNPHHLLRAPFLPAFKDKALKGTKGCNMGIYKKDLLAVNGFNEDFTGWGREDSELAARLYKYGLRRKTHPFMAVCFHLWHEKFDMERLDANEKILQATVEGDSFRCENGIYKNSRAAAR